MVKYQVKLLTRASRDLDNIYNYIVNEFKEIETAEHMADLLENAILGLDKMPYRGPIRKVGSFANKEYLMAIITVFCWGTIGYFLYTALYNHGLTLLPAQTACILNYLWPIFTVLFSTILLKEKLDLSKWLALGLSFLGIIVIMFQPGNENPMDINSIIGSFSCILAAALYAFFSVMNKKRGGSQLINMFVYIGVSALIALYFCAKDGFTVPAISQIPGLLWLGIFVNAAGYSLWAMALQGSSTASIANFAYITPALSLFLSALFLKEPIYLSSVLGLLLIIGGLFLQIFLERKGTKKTG